jgi:D-sedoheptulose 7-phosphate isomerase
MNNSDPALVQTRFAQHIEAAQRTGDHLAARIPQAATLIVDACRAGGAILLFGNGGSAADAQHIAGELVGRFLKERQAYRAQALTTDSSILTAVANDYTFDRIFVRQLEAQGRPGDVAIALSTSGNSPNIVTALEYARKQGLKTIAITGEGGGLCAPLADVLLDTQAQGSPAVQNCTAIVYHILCELVEEALSSE